MFISPADFHDSNAIVALPENGSRDCCHLRFGNTPKRRGISNLRYIGLSATTRQQTDQMFQRFRAGIGLPVPQRLASSSSRYQSHVRCEYSFVKNPEQILF